MEQGATMSQESMQVLTMLSEGKLTVEQATRLLDALGGTRRSSPTSTTTSEQRPPDEFYARLSPNELIELRNHGVEPEYVRAMRSQGFAALSARELIELYNHGVAPDYIRGLREAGLTNLSLQQLIELS